MGDDIHIALIGRSIVHLGIRDASLGGAANRVHVHRTVNCRAGTRAACVHQERLHRMRPRGVHKQPVIFRRRSGILQALCGGKGILVHEIIQDIAVLYGIVYFVGSGTGGADLRRRTLNSGFRFAVDLIDTDRSPDGCALRRYGKCAYIIGNLLIADGSNCRGFGADIGAVLHESLRLRVDKVYACRTSHAQTAAVIYAATNAHGGDVRMADRTQVKTIAGEAAAGESGRSMGFVTGDAHAHTNSGGLAHGGHGGIGAEIVSGAGFHIEIASGVLDIRAGHFSGHIGRLQPYRCRTVHSRRTISQTHAKTNGGQAGCIGSRDIYLGGIMVNGSAIDYSAVYLTISIANGIISHSTANGRPLGQGKAAGYRQFLRIIFGGYGNTGGILHRAAGKFGLDIIRTAVYRYGTIGGQLLPGSGHTCSHGINTAFILGADGNGLGGIICKLGILYIGAGSVFQTVVGTRQAHCHIAHGHLARHIDILGGGIGIDNAAAHALDLGAADFCRHVIAVSLPAEGTGAAETIRSATSPGSCADGQRLAVRLDI